MVRQGSRFIVLFLLVSLLGGGWTSWTPAAAQTAPTPGAEGPDGAPAPGTDAGTPPNDDRGDARAIALGETIEQSTVGATLAGGERFSCVPGGGSVWFRFTPTDYSPLVIDTRGSDFDTVVAVHRSATNGTYEEACDDDGYGLRSVVRFSGSPQTTFLIQVGGADAAAGKLRLRVSRPTGAIEGSLVDPETGAGPGRYLCMSLVDANGRTMGYYGGPTAADQAKFRFSGLQDGTYRVQAFECYGISQRTYAPTWSGGATSADAAAEVVVADGAVTSLPPIELLAGGVVDGSVVDEAGAPLANICVSAYSSPSAWTGASARTGADGSYRLTALPTGSFLLRYGDCTWPASRAPEERTADVVAGATTTAPPLVMSSGAKISGTVRNGLGQPAANVCVLTGGPTPTHQAVTAADGTYTLSMLRPGAYRVRFTPCPWNPGAAAGLAAEWYEDASSSGRATSVVVGSGELRAGVDAVLDPAAVITGTVSGPDGAGVARACVAVHDGDDGQRLTYTTTSVTGTYRLDSLRKGRYQVRVGECEAQLPYVPFRADEVKVRPGAAESLDVALDRGSWIDGEVRSADAGKRLAACVTTASAAGTRGSSSLEPGRFSIRGLPAGDYDVAARPCGSPHPLHDDVVSTSRVDGTTDVSGLTLAMVTKDPDGDGVRTADNCRRIANPDQRDGDGDDLGDACDADRDGDLVPDDLDNCDDLPDGNQGDLDGDGAGDGCDADDDGDEAIDVADNCPSLSNADQGDIDGDGLGDACDAQDDRDADGDGSIDVADNCPSVANADQGDVDGDGVGDACDDQDDRDGDRDGVVDLVDNCPSVANADQADVDGDGRGDACDGRDDRDGDADGVIDVADNCPFVANADQADVDGDGAGDACDGRDDRDDDADGVIDAVDNCPASPNGDQSDVDGDGAGDACDAFDGRDSDGDGVSNGADNCPTVPNASQLDLDGNGVGDACQVAAVPEPKLPLGTGTLRLV